MNRHIMSRKNRKKQRIFIGTLLEREQSALDKGLNPTTFSTDKPLSRGDIYES